MPSLLLSNLILVSILLILELLIVLFIVISVLNEMILLDFLLTLLMRDQKRLILHLIILILQLLDARLDHFSL